MFSEHSSLLSHRLEAVSCLGLAHSNPTLDTLPGVFWAFSLGKRQYLWPIFESLQLIGWCWRTSLLFLKRGLTWNLLSLLWSLKRATMTEPSKATWGGGSFLLCVQLAVLPAWLPRTPPPYGHKCVILGVQPKNFGTCLSSVQPRPMPRRIYFSCLPAQFSLLQREDPANGDLWFQCQYEIVLKLETF